MSHEHIKNTNASDLPREDAHDLIASIEAHRNLNRTPRPYLHDGSDIQQDAAQPAYLNDGYSEQRRDRSAHVDTESGTEADDERPQFVKELPAPVIRPRKGLKTGESNLDVLLTPAQLDAEEVRLLREELRTRTIDANAPLGESLSADLQGDIERVQRRRLGEFLRRLSEVYLVLIMAICVLCGKGVLAEASKHRYALSCHMAIIIGLIAGYPVKLSIIDTRNIHYKIWERFRVPSSFDPATVLYPPLLPLLVAMSVAPANPGVILPNVVLGLASLAQRLFPRSSRLRSLNELHWLISILPVVVSRRTLVEANTATHIGTLLTAETLVTLYPLHYALLGPLMYITQTSLLISEAHLLSAAFINLLLLAQSPQVIILKACLWVGGLGTFVFCAPVLHWYLTLVRVPKWRFRRPKQGAEEELPLPAALIAILTFQRFSARATDCSDSESDADEVSSPKEASKLGDSSNSIIAGIENILSATNLRRCHSGRSSMNGAVTTDVSRPRRNTMPDQSQAVNSTTSTGTRSKRRQSQPWYLRLTADEARLRKQAYTVFYYIATVVIILGPIQFYVSRHALSNYNPIVWAIGYMVGQLPFMQPVLSLVDMMFSTDWPAAPNFYFTSVRLEWPLDIDHARSAIGEANARLLIVAYWALVLLIGLLSVFSLTAFVEVDTRRKVFHGVMVAMLLPSVFVDPCCCALALTLILTVFLLLEVFRAGQVPPLGNAIGRFVAPYIDGRDLRGPVVVSHIFLLIGCAIPLWFSLASISRTGDLPWKDWNLAGNQREVAMLAGVICVGMGDAAASLIGRRYGRHKWPWVGGKSLEGSAAFAVAVTIGLVAMKFWQIAGGWQDTTATNLDGYLGRQGVTSLILIWSMTIFKAGICACAASFMEAVLTGANDNVVVPIALWLLVKGCRI